MPVVFSPGQTVRLAWVTDIHLEFLEEAARARFCDRIRELEPDGVLVGGDTALAQSCDTVLREMARRVRKPIWFVLGNHDFYGGSVAEVRERATSLSAEGRAVWLGAVDVIELTPRTALVGHDGWGDAGFGDHDGSTVMLNDFYRIADLLQRDKPRLGEALRRLGEESAAHLRRVLPQALERFEQVVVLTHVPPFREACWHEGRISSDAYLPYFACKATGDALLEEVGRHPDRSVTVLCGHTPSSGECHPLPNLRVVTGGAEYGKPIVQSPLLSVI
jgi:3',5'-cyclic AMP phosphodiesterase CpdA